MNSVSALNFEMISSGEHLHQWGHCLEIDESGETISLITDFL